MPGRSFAVATLGCKVNQYDSEVIATAMEEAGYHRVSFDSSADVYIINTCAVTATAAQKSRQLSRRARRQDRHALVVMAGCYPQAESAEARRVEGVDLWVGTGAMSRLPQLVDEALDGNVSGVAGLPPPDPFAGPAGMQARGRALVKIQEGCEHYCSYCLVPRARGPYRSRDPQKARDEVAELMARGHREVVITGVHLGAYGRDRDDGMDLSRFLESLDDVAGPGRIRLSSLEPMDLGCRLLSVVAERPWICHHLHLPLQSGSDAVLDRMNRPYTAAGFARIAARARELMPDLGLTTDIMVGFPGETGEEFAASLRNVDRIGFSRLHVFPYSQRPGTPAASFPGQVPGEVSRRRREIMIEKGREMTRGFYRRSVGKRLEVLLEQRSGDGFLGYSGNYIRTRVHGPGYMVGDLAPVKVVDAGDREVKAVTQDRC